MKPVLTQLVATTQGAKGPIATYLICLSQPYLLALAVVSTWRQDVPRVNPHQILQLGGYHHPGDQVLPADLQVLELPALGLHLP